MRSTNPDILQMITNRTIGGGVRTPVNQLSGIWDGTVYDSDVTNPSLPTGTMRVLIPAFSTNFYFSGEYPGNAPANGAACVVGFITPTPNSQTGNQMRVLAFPGYSPAYGSVLDPFLLMGA